MPVTSILLFNLPPRFQSEPATGFYPHRYIFHESHWWHNSQPEVQNLAAISDFPRTIENFSKTNITGGAPVVNRNAQGHDTIVHIPALTHSPTQQCVHSSLFVHAPKAAQSGLQY